MNFLADAFREIIEEIEHEKRLDEIRKYDTDDVLVFWSNLGDSSFYEGPEGLFDCADIYMVLSERGHADKCDI